MAVDYVGKQALSFEKGKELEPIAQVILNLGTDDEGNALIAKYPAADPQSGRIVEYELPLITSTAVAANIAQNIYTKLSDFTYKPFSAEGALLDPSYQIGDSVNVNGGVYALGSIRTIADHLYSADISAPMSEEEDHEYTVNNNRIAGELKKLIARTESSIRTTIDSITLTVESIEGDISTTEQTLGGIISRVSSAEGNISTLSQTVGGIEITISSEDGTSVFKLGSNGTTISTQTIDLTVDAVNISGTLSASQIATNIAQVNNILRLGDSEATQSRLTFSNSCYMVRNTAGDLLAFNNIRDITMWAPYGDVELIAGSGHAVMVNGDLTAGGKLTVGPASYGTTLPASGSPGEIFFLI